MTRETAVLLGAMLIFAFFQLFLIGISIWRTRRWIKLRRVEETRGQFAVARSALMRLALDGKIDSTTEAFRILYGIHTFVMRRPDKYAEIGRMSHDVLRKSSTSPSPETIQGMDAEVLEPVCAMTATGFKTLILNYSPYLRFRAWATRVSVGLLLWPLVKLVAFLHQRLQRKEKEIVITSLEESEQQFRRLSRHQLTDSNQFVGSH